MSTDSSAEGSLTYTDGWFAEEQDGDQSFRWMSRQARCRFTGLGSTGPGWLRVTAGVGRSAPGRPVLSVVVNGKGIGTAQPGTEITHHVFPIDIADVLDVTLTVDRSFTAGSDPRDLGLMVRALEVFSQEDAAAPVDAEGWYEWERHEYFPFRWMGREARLLLPRAVRQRGRYATVPILSPAEAESPALTLSAAGRAIGDVALRPGWHIYDVELPDPAGAPGDSRAIDVRFAVSLLLPRERHPDDPRDLGIAVGELEVHDQRRRHEHVRTFHEAMRQVPVEADNASGDAGAGGPERDLRVLPEGAGWHNLEAYEREPFRWMRLEARTHIAAWTRRGGFLVARIFSSFQNLTQELTVLADGDVLGRVPLLPDWHSYSFALPDRDHPSGLDLAFRLNKLVPSASHPDDPRDLGVRVGVLIVHEDRVRHERDVFLGENDTLRCRELRAGATVLSSFPSTLGIDLYGKCNIKPPCVYCPWEQMKALEGSNVDAVIDDHTLESYQSFFRAAAALVNCSFGEPLLHPRLEQILELFARHGKTVELATNGQAFSAQIVRALAGKPVFLYVSLDAASPDTYRRLRNDRWQEIVAGLLFLRDAKLRARGWPKVNLVYMPMRANRHDLEACFKLCRLVAADTLVLRPLLLDPAGEETERSGHRFGYQETLGRSDLEGVVADCARFADEYDVPVRAQFDFGKIDFRGIDPHRQSPAARGDR